MRALSACGQWIYIERIRPTHSPGGIILPETFEAKHSARLKTAATLDTFEARVLSVGPEVSEDVYQGDTVVAYTYAEGDGSKLFTGEKTGERNRLFIKADDILFAIERDEAAE